ncbi:MAG: type II toxin-antitoxin system RelE/ParE family toxin [Thiomicrospira sp.]|uniref:type II toxin-antitoxin system RelE/ParE family toxin n=1 Tax=Thiomicrospira sp. TaxID=935 RepID=UPI001A0594AF|nr:type II toxin-antitoxin system RelE/ParE family toxin [Thiomicrospira sp.]MBE0494077.1 type II toxin-antitoxin system RelE/ParE family toxin [Thiomicrospira sp.]
MRQHDERTLMKVRYTKQALNDLARLRQFIAEHNPRAAQAIASQLLHAVERLKPFPLLGIKVASSPNPQTMRDMFVKNYTLRYLIGSSEIIILRIWHDKERERSTILHDE